MYTTNNPPFRTHRGGLSTAKDIFEAEAFFPVIEFTTVPFDLQQVQRALFESTYRKPITLLFPKERAHIRKIATDIAMTVELAHALYELNEDDEPSAECYDLPEWYLRGVAYFTGPTGEQEAAPAHVYLQIEEGSVIGLSEVQVLIDPDRLETRPAGTDGG
jgi:hypothetical protein